MEIAAVIFVIVMLGVAYIVFKLLKKAAKMAIRSVIVLLILVIAIAGGLALWSFNGKSAPEKTPATKKSN
jgi:hypothetical protein